MTYSGWNTVIVVWLDGTQEDVAVVGAYSVVVRDGILVLRVSDQNDYRRIPLTSIREWRTREYH